MGLLFGRKIELYIINRQKNTTTTLDIKDLRITFDVDKSSVSDPNKGSVTIYGLSEKSRALIQDRTKTNLYSSILLQAGYGTEIGKIVEADIVTSKHAEQGAETITTLQCADGDYALRNVFFDKSYKAKTDIKAIVKDILQELKNTGKVNLNNTVNNVTSHTLQNGTSFTGQVQSILDNLLRRQGLIWSIQDNEIQIYPETGNDNSESVLLTPQTGLIGSPIKTKDGYEITSLIMGSRLRVGRKVNIQSKKLNGVYVPFKIKYKGDTDGNDWYVTMEVR